MSFPEVRRVIYKQKILDKVICQVRFPPILKIDAVAPADFQEGIRKSFPQYLEKRDIDIEVPEGFPAGVFQNILQPLGKNYEFSSEDGEWTVNLTKTFLALTSSNYEKWEEFIAQFKIPLNSLIQTYQPNHFSRIGLRYTDIINRTKLKLPGVPWVELINEPVLGLVGSSIGENVKAFETVYEVRLPKDGNLARIATRFIQAKENDEACFVIDTDFSDSQKSSSDGAGERLEYLHSCASRLLRWCIKDKLHYAMEPDPV